MTRKPKVPILGELYRVHVILTGNMLAGVDRMAAEEATGDESPEHLRNSSTRSSVIRRLVFDGLKKRNLLAREEGDAFISAGHPSAKAIRVGERILSTIAKAHKVKRAYTKATSKTSK